MEFDLHLSMRIPVPLSTYNPFEPHQTTSTRLKVMSECWGRELERALPKLKDRPFDNSVVWTRSYGSGGRYLDGNMKYADRGEVLPYYNAIPSDQHGHPHFKEGTSIRDLIRDCWSRGIRQEQCIYEGCRIGHALTAELVADLYTFYQQQMESEIAQEETRTP